MSISFLSKIKIKTKLTNSISTKTEELVLKIETNADLSYSDIMEVKGHMNQWCEGLETLEEKKKRIREEKEEDLCIIWTCSNFFMSISFLSKIKIKTKLTNSISILHLILVSVLLRNETGSTYTYLKMQLIGRMHVSNSSEIIKGLGLEL
jgi:hypothetical protein